MSFYGGQTCAWAGWTTFIATRYVLNTLPAEDYPAMALDPEKTIQVQAPSKDLVAGLKFVAWHRGEGVIDRAPSKTPRQRAAFRRRADRVMRRLRQRWGYGFRQDMRERARINKARRMGVGFMIVLLDEIRRMR